MNWTWFIFVEIEFCGVFAIVILYKNNGHYCHTSITKFKFSKLPTLPRNTQTQNVTVFVSGEIRDIVSINSSNIQ